MTCAELQKFCSTDPLRPDIWAPFSSGEWTYATNGHIAVRVPRLADVAENVAAPNALIAAMFSRFSTDLQFTPAKFRELPTHPLDEQCSSCGGITAGLRGAVFNLKYVRMLAELPGTRLPVTIDPSNKVPTPFRFDGGEGLLMPMRAEAEMQAE